MTVIERDCGGPTGYTVRMPVIRLAHSWSDPLNIGFRREGRSPLDPLGVPSGLARQTLT